MGGATLQKRRTKFLLGKLLGYAFALLNVVRTSKCRLFIWLWVNDPQRCGEKKRYRPELRPHSTLPLYWGCQGKIKEIFHIQKLCGFFLSVPDFLPNKTKMLVKNLLCTRQNKGVCLQTCHVPTICLKTGLQNY